MEIKTVVQPVRLELDLTPEDIRVLKAVTPNLPSQYDFRCLVGCDSELSRKYLHLVERIGMAVGADDRTHASKEVREMRTF